MKTYKISRTDLVVSRIAYGCGHWFEPNLVGLDGSDDEIQGVMADAGVIASLKDEFEKWRKAPVNADGIAKSVRLIYTAYDNGITFFDHADIYGWGKCEAAFGEVLKQSPGLRDKIVIQSKCGIRFASDFLEPPPDDPHRLDCSGEHIVSSAEASLRRLSTDHLDILLLHRPDALVEPEEVARAFDELQRSGKVRYFGVSNHTAAQIELLKKFVRQPLVVNQIQLGLAHSYLIADGIEANQDDSTRINHGYAGVAGTLDYCRLHDMQVQAWSPLKRGNNSPGLLNPPADAGPEVNQVAQILADLAEKKSASPAAIALAWLLRHPAGIVPIIGTTNPEHLIECCAADRLMLSREEWYTLFVSGAGVPALQLLGLVSPKKPS
jgi:predicted oxidoreductase